MGHTKKKSLRQMAHDQEVVGSNRGTVYWMDLSNWPTITLKKIGNKGSQMGHTKKKRLFISSYAYRFVNETSYCLSQSDHIKQLSLYLQIRIQLVYSTT